MYEDRYFEPAIELLERPQLRALQEARLLELLPYVYERSPLVNHVWRAAGVQPRDISSLDDYFERAPYMDKNLLRQFREDHQDPFSGLATDVGDTWAVATTSGTTGDPTAIPYVGRQRGVEEPATYLSTYTRALWELGVRPGDYVSFTLFTFRGPVFGNAQRVGAVPVVYSHDPAEMHRLCRQSLELRPKALYVMSSVLLLELERLEEAGSFDIADVLSGCAVIWGGEPMGSRARAAFARWGADVFDHGAAGDVTLTFECRAKAGGHFPEDAAIAEYQRLTDGAPAADGDRAELVVTSLDPALPLLRFRSDDVVVPDRSLCPCGRSHARIRVVGRVSDSFEVGGRSVLPSEVWLAVEAVPETSAGLFQIVAPSRKLDRLRLRVGFEDHGRQLSDLTADLRASVSSFLDTDPDIELVAQSELLKLGPPHKIPRVVSQ